MVDWACSNYDCAILIVISHFFTFSIFSLNFYKEQSFLLPSLIYLFSFYSLILVWKMNFYYLCSNIIIHSVQIIQALLNGAPVLLCLSLYSHPVQRTLPYFRYHKMFQVHFCIVLIQPSSHLFLVLSSR